ncbi:hypothetical protein F2Q70_00019189 [Brassica cretica]|uniref:Uncharacterized protein n=1 Tax=Brassica cretica TaxID=69181 RepID=A0A8S9GRF3_BRACR|nr:hypothetical protein F2Q70_00019189 [Brassica cretica]
MYSVCFLERQLVDLENATYTSHVIEGAMEVEEAAASAPWEDLLFLGEKKTLKNSYY